MDKKIVAYLLLFYVIFTLYNTLIPFTFDYSFSDLPVLIKQITIIPTHKGVGRFSITDIVGNILLFIPFGFLAYMFFIQREIRHPILLSVLGGGFLSFVIEFMQLFIKARNTGLHDLLNNTLGSLIGAGVAAIYYHKISAISRKIFYELLDRKPFLLIPVIVGVLQIIAAAAPFTVSITFSDVAKSVKSFNFIPFTYRSVGALFLDSPNRNDLEVLQHGFDFTPMLEDIIFWATIGYLLMLCYRMYWRNDSRVKIALYVLPFLYFCFLEGLQLMIVNRITDVNDIISGYSGFLLGYLLYRVLRPIRRRQYHDDLDLLKIPVIMYIIFIFFSGFRPFDWSLSKEVISLDLKAENLIPFYAYFRSTKLSNIYDLVDSLSFFFPISLYWSFRMKEKGVHLSRIYIITTVTALLSGSIIELSQLFSTTRVAEITDILSYGCGGALGTFALYYYENEIIPKVNLLRRGLLQFT
ncbi:MAG: VanZ family protein [Calditrichaeota bacterium]|nr:MAG: VanZ family protein [Calditrichota bacterium]